MRNTSALLALAFVIACGDDESVIDSSIEMPGDGGGAETGPGEVETDGSVDGEIDGACSDDGDCSDGFACNGRETCVDRQCVQGAPPPCTQDHPCLEPSGECNCSNPSRDGDAFKAIACGGDDCDDRNPNIHPNATEVCANGGASIDEDCDWTTFYDEKTKDGDADGDGFVSSLCFNYRPGAAPNGGDDCADDDKTTNVDAVEECDYADNNCNGKSDEGKRGGQGPIQAGGLQEPFYPDVDGDGTGDQSVEPTHHCARYAPAGVVPASAAEDCDDQNDDRNIYETELCDGFDNDCDELTDGADDNEQPLLKPVEFTDTVVECLIPEGETKPRWVITDCPGEPGDPDEKLWCSDVVDFGCTVDATSLDSCRECGNACNFACGRAACDEVAHVAAGVDHTCASSSEVTACWGRGALGRLGTGVPGNTFLPAPVIALSGASTIASGPNSSCAVVGEELDLFCWGSNQSGLLGSQEPGLASSDVPLPVVGAWGEPQLAGVLRIELASEHACAVLMSGELYCWGSEADGRLGNNSDSSFVDSPISVEREEEYVLDAADVAVGEHHGCLVTFDGGVECWGDNTFGQLGDPSFTESHSTTARAVPGLDDVSAITAGLNHTCALRDGQVLCWGGNGRSQLGRVSSPDDGVPTAVAQLDDVVAIDAGSQLTCALDELATAWCWGSNEYGERGAAGGEDSAVPHAIEIAGDVTEISAGGNHVCALSEQQLYCWGTSFYGQLGHGSSSYEGQPIPQEVKPLNR